MTRKGVRCAGVTSDGRRQTRTEFAPRRARFAPAKTRGEMGKQISTERGAQTAMSFMNKQDVGQLFRFILGRCSLCLSGAICRRPAVEAAVCMQVVPVKSRPWTKRATSCWLPLCEEERNGALSGLLLIVRREESSRLQPRCRALHGGSLRAQDGPDGNGRTWHNPSEACRQP